MDRKKILLGIKIFIAISLVTQLGIFFYTSCQNVGFALKFPFHESNYYMMGVAFCLSWLEGPVSGIRIYFIMKVINPRISMLTSVKAAYANIFLGAATPSQTGGGVAQIYFISRDKIPISQASGGVHNVFCLHIALSNSGPDFDIIISLSSPGTLPTNNDEERFYSGGNNCDVLHSFSPVYTFN